MRRAGGLANAERNIKAVCNNLSGSKPTTEVNAYHRQQAAQRAVFRNMPPEPVERTHKALKSAKYYWDRLSGRGQPAGSCAGSN